MMKILRFGLIAAFAGVLVTGCSGDDEPFGLMQDQQAAEVPAAPSFDFTALNSNGVPPFYASSVDLIADGRDNPTTVGQVFLWNDGSDLFVKYVITDTDWCLLGTHFAVGTELQDIPQNNQNNPKVGQFPYGDGNLACVDHWGTVIPLADIGAGPGDELYAAAHAGVAEVGNPMDGLIVSGDGETRVTGQRSGCDGAFTPLDQAAVAAGEPCAPPVGSYGSCLTPSDASPSVWDQQLSDQSLLTDGADWIWEAYAVEYPTCGEVVSLQRDFTVDYLLDAGDFDIACDNGYKAYLNGTPLGSGQVGADFETSDLTEPYVNSAGWQQVGTAALDGILVEGDNSLVIDAANERFAQGEDAGANGTHAFDGNIYYNPGGCIFRIAYSYARTETAWGEGTEFNEQKSWATYFRYTVLGDPFYVRNTDNVSGNIAGQNISAQVTCDPGDVAVHGSAHLRSGWYLNKSIQVPGNENAWDFQGHREDDFAGATDFAQFRVVCYDTDWYEDASADDFYPKQASGVIAGFNVDGDVLCNAGDIPVGAGWHLRSKWFVNKIRPQSSGGQAGWDFQGRRQETVPAGDTFSQFRAVCATGDLADMFYIENTANIADQFAGYNLSTSLSCDPGDVGVSGIWHLRSNVYVNKSRQNPSDESEWEFQARQQYVDGAGSSLTGDFAQFRNVCFDWTN